MNCFFLDNGQVIEISRADGWFRVYKIDRCDTIDIIDLIDFSPGKQLNLVLHHSDGDSESIKVNHSYNQSQIEWFKAGSALNLIKAKEKS